MAKIKNTTNASLGLPNGTRINSGRTVRVDDWETIKANSVVAAWLAVGALTVVEEKAPAPQQQVDNKSTKNSKTTTPPQEA